LNRKDAKDAKFKRRSRDIVQNRVSVLDKAAFSFAACPVKREACLTRVTRQMKKHPVFLGDLRVLSDHAKAWERAVNCFFGLLANLPENLLQFNNQTNQWQGFIEIQAQKKGAPGRP
jgi:hypothetical protein